MIQTIFYISISVFVLSIILIAAFSTFEEYFQMAITCMIAVFSFIVMITMVCIIITDEDKTKEEQQAIEWNEGRCINDGEELALYNVERVGKYKLKLYYKCNECGRIVEVKK